MREQHGLVSSDLGGTSDGENEGDNATNADSENGSFPAVVPSREPSNTYFWLGKDICSDMINNEAADGLTVHWHETCSRSDWMSSRYKASYLHR